MPFRLGKVGPMEKLWDKLQNIRKECFLGGRNSSFGGCKILGLLDSYLGVGGVWKKCDSCLTNCNFDRPHLGEKNAGSSSHFLGEGRSKISLHARYHINICHELSPWNFKMMKIPFVRKMLFCWQL